MAGGTCGILCWIVVFPIDLIKSVMQKDIMAPKPTYDTIRECVSDIKARQGYRGFYRGMSVTLMRAFPIHSLNFLVYEQVLQFARKTAGH
jgi:Mitochondrial carrier protein